MLPKKRTRIDALTRPEHSLLTEDDECYFLGEYTAGAGFSTATNDLILNFKILPSVLVDKPQRERYKLRAIQHVGECIRPHFCGIPEDWVVVPIPSSKVVGHADHDDRLMRALQSMSGPMPQIRELIKQCESTSADHEGGRQSFDELLANCYVDESCADPPPRVVVLFDDVITDGKHFKVCQRLLHERYGRIRVIGFFLARRIRQDVALDFDSIFGDD